MSCDNSISSVKVNPLAAWACLVGYDDTGEYDLVDVDNPQFFRSQVNWWSIWMDSSVVWLALS